MPTKNDIVLFRSPQNRRQKVINRGLYVCTGGLYVRAGGLDIPI